MKDNTYFFQCHKCSHLIPQAYRLEDIGTDKRISVICPDCGNIQEVAVCIDKNCFIDYPLSLRSKLVGKRKSLNPIDDACNISKMR